MKKIIVYCSILLLFVPIFAYAEDIAAPNEGETKQQEQIKNEESSSGASLIQNATSGVLMEASTGQILFEKNKDDQVAIASMTKMVAQILILEAIESGKIKWTDKVTASENASGMGGSQIFLSTGESLSVTEMMKGISMASANDATVAMAEFLSGTEVEFVKKMNEKVKKLGLKNTQFKNCTGLDEEGHYSSAYDMAVIARELLRHEDILKFSSLYEDYLRADTANKFWLVNTNKLVRFYEGADGLKTGHTDAAKYCLAATAKRNDLRLIAIVLGEEVSKVRNSETMALLDYGFNSYQINVIKKKGQKVKTITLEKATEEKIDLVPAFDIGVLSKKGEEKKKYAYSVTMNKQTLPFKKGDIVGKIQVMDKDKVVVEGDLTVNKNSKALSFPSLFVNTMRDIMTGDCSFD